MTVSNISILITAAGSSSRMGGGNKKEYLPLQNGTVLSCCAKTFLNAFSKRHKKNFNIKHFVVTVPENMKKNAEQALFEDSDFSSLCRELGIEVSFVTGGSSRQKSVFNALDFIRNNGSTDIVLVHDGARPFVTEKIIFDVIDGVLECGAAVPGMTPTDTIKELDEKGIISRHLVRKNLLAVQTPQGFDFNSLYEAHLKAMKVDYEYTDDAEIYGIFAGSVKTVAGDEKNIKITYPQDLKRL